MQLKVQPIDIKVGKYKVVLNSIDAKELGVIEGDRVRVRNHESLTAIVDFTEDMIPPGMIGVYHELQQKLNKQWTETVEVTPASRPKSARLIRKIMDRQILTKDEIYEIVRGIVDESLSDIELSAFITSTYINDLTDDETEWLTRAMIDTGEK